MPPSVSLIVPVWADSGAAERLLAATPADPRLEVIIAAAGDVAPLEALASARPDITLVHGARGRAVQMNAGAARARGAWLLFVHADSMLPDGWLDLFLRATPGACGGWFRFALDDPSWQARVVERGVRWRVRLFRLPYGDQGLFATREAFAALGGYRELALMEDVDFIRRLARQGRMVELPAALVTSARRWRADGWLRRSARNAALVILYFAGVPAARLARWYAAG